jgi:1-deoxyxylulose-5-phosphate synthase
MGKFITEKAVCHAYLSMKSEHLSRREFLGQAALATGAAVLASTKGSLPEVPGTAPADAPITGAAKRTASDLVPLGNTGLKVSRLGIGLGTSNGQMQAAGGQEKFNGFIKHAFDQGITMYDTAGNYVTFDMVGPAIKGLPREKIFLQSKIEQPNNVLDTIDRQRKALNTDYVDSMLVHLQYRENWVETWKRAFDDFVAAQEKKWIKTRGVSCHSLPAIRAALATDWTQAYLVRVNPQGIRIDSEQQIQDTNGRNDIAPVLPELKKMKEKKRGVIGMKIFGGGQFRTEADRERSMKFAMSMPEIDSVIIGFSSIDEMDQGIKLMNRVLAEPAG